MKRNLQPPNVLLEKWVRYEQTFLFILYAHVVYDTLLRKDRHHRIPKSRCKQWNMNAGFEGNMVPMTRVQHAAWHALFGNLIAEEVLYLLTVCNWRPSTPGQQAAWRLIFYGSTSIQEAKRMLRNKWSIRHANPALWKQVHYQLEQELELYRPSPNGLGLLFLKLY